MFLPCKLSSTPQNVWLTFSDESGVCAWSETAVGGALWYDAQLSVGFLYSAKFNIIWSGGNGAITTWT